MNPQQKNVSPDFKKQEQKSNLPACTSLGEAEPLPSTGRRCGRRSVRRTSGKPGSLLPSPLPSHTHSRRNVPQSPGLLPDLTPLLRRSPRPEPGPRGGGGGQTVPPTPTPCGQTWSYSTCPQTSPGKMEEWIGSRLRVCRPKEFHFVNFSEN